MSNLIVVKLTDSKNPAAGGLVTAVCNSLDEAQAARNVPACGTSRYLVRDSNRVIWRGYPTVKVGDRVSL